MSDFVALNRSSLRDEHTTKPASRFSLGKLLGAAMESLVAAHERQFEGTEQTFYRYPPI